MTKYKNETWTIFVEDQETMEATRMKTVENQSDAELIAKEWAGESEDGLVYIEYNRKSDGQKMYLNEDGYELSGEAWKG